MLSFFYGVDDSDWSFRNYDILLTKFYDILPIFVFARKFAT